MSNGQELGRAEESGGRYSAPLELSVVRVARILPHPDWLPGIARHPGRVVDRIGVVQPPVPVGRRAGRFPVAYPVDSDSGADNPCFLAGELEPVPDADLDLRETN